MGKLFDRLRKAIAGGGMWLGIVGAWHGFLIFMPVRYIERSRTRDFLQRLGRGRRALVAAVGPGTAVALALCLAAAILVPAVAIGWLVGVRETDTMLESGQARHAVEALKRSAGPRMQVRSLEIAPREMNVWAVDPDMSPWRYVPGNRQHFARNVFVPNVFEQSWRVTHWTLFSGWREWHRVTGPEPEGIIERNRGPSFELRPEDIPDLPELARAAMRRVGLEGTGTVASMALDSRRWTLRLSSQLGITEVVFDRPAEGSGAHYATGRGVTKDYAEALRWYRKAADQGDPVAMYDVGLIYANGLGVPTNRVEARQWMDKAAAGGHDAAKQCSRHIRWFEMLAADTSGRLAPANCCRQARRVSTRPG